ncbi:hypothetical protein Q4R51_16860 [Morganella morganii]|uniref:hypothetical protein n=1 Tax=Morganella morganii TaxID=582 RepID=UPI001BDA7D9C|nr:hypothetical protein [Morganella morganii]EKU4000838.1 hypothetical protein [Morganella morganii]MBT0405150.1 hypothetical protein [Morganella morganii subsp. morganii]
MIKVRALANTAIQCVNKNLPAVLMANDGYEIDESGRQIAKYVESDISVQLQSLSTQDLEHLGVITQQGEFIYGYARGKISALRRAKQQGQDKLRFAAYGEDDVSVWNVTKVIESYPSWVKVLLWRQ